ncbi:MAG TPA: TonB-dependent receptor, partial [Candidatus Baltobacteraceae bacterium]|nr:TonB-dependent receptor [Candidatus Baltobacteraceae bacterium]
PLVIPTNNSTYNILDGSGGPGPNYGAIFSPGNSYAQATNFDRENIFNLHWAIPHKHSPMRDDIQALYVTGGINTQFYSSPDELGPAGVNAAIGYPVPFLTSTYYNGPLMQPPNTNDLVNGPYPSAPEGKTFVDNNQRDGSFNGYSIEKVQYQKNINDHSFLRVLGYSEWSDWFINAPTSAQLTFGAELADYEVKDNAFGGGLTYANQLSPKNSITAQISYMTQKLQTYNATFSSTDPNTTSLPATGLGTVLSNYIDNSGNCYNYTTGQVWSCFDAASQGSTTGAPNDLAPANCVADGTCPGSAAAQNAAHWIMTENGYSAQIDDVQPFFTSYSLTDLWQPNDRLTFNVGARFDHFVYSTKDLMNGYPARQFWFNAYNREHCGALGSSPVWTWNADPNNPDAFASCSALGGNLAPLTDPGNGLYNVGSGFTTSSVFQPRIAGTWLLNPDTVVRGSYGRYARAEASAYFQDDAVQQNLASFIAQFYSYGYHTPNHAIYPDTSDNYDLSLEKHVHGTDMSFKLSPFYRSTRNQIQYLAIDALGGTLAGLNVGTQQSYGVEFAFDKGDFSRNGLSYQLAYTHTTSKIRYRPINGQNVINSLNGPIEQYNSYTYGCSLDETQKQCGSGQYAANGAASFDNSGSGGPANVPNPYYCKAVSAACPYQEQPLLDPNGQYTPYDVIPTPFNAANGYEVPDVVSLVLNYRHNRLAVTPSLRWNNGSYYGSPVQWPGYVPQGCTALPSDTPTTPGVSCGSGGAIFLPDPYNGNRFDNLGTFRQPSELTFNLQASYDVSARATITVSALNLYHKCFQRGYAWDSSTTCVYSSLPSNILGASGNFLTNPPPQVAYPYGTFFNITEVGTTSVLQPFNLFVNLNIKI